MARQDTHGPFRLLLAEDDDGDARALLRALQQAAIEVPVERVVDGVEALERLRRTCADCGRADIPCILLTDLNMPRMDGIELLEALRSDPRLRHMAVFVLTTSGAQQDICAAWQFNVAGYIRKQNTGEGFAGLTGLLEQYQQIVDFPGPDCV
jgi:CheY-like chemotaxis protein